MLDMKVLETEVRTILIRRRDAGIEWLTSEDAEWFKKADLDTFEFGDPKVCVIGQVYGSDAYGTMRVNGWGRGEFNRINGFTINSVDIAKDLPYMGEDDDDARIWAYINGPAWEVMNELWKESIKELQSA